MTRISNQTRKYNKDRDKPGKQINLNPNSNTNKTPKSTRRLIREINKLEINQRYDLLLSNFYVWTYHKDRHHPCNFHWFGYAADF